MKFNFLQGDFSTGELSPRAQGHADAEAYKAGLRLASNCAPTRAGSIASRAGLEALLEGIDGNTLLPSNLPVQHLPILDGPWGDFVLEVSPTGLRMVDKFGIVIPWNFLPTSEFLQFTAQDGAFAYADTRTRSVYLKSALASGVRSYYLSKTTPTAYGGAGGADPQNAIIAGAALGAGGPDVGPPGTNHNWILSGKIAGDGVTAHIVQSTPANFQDIPIAAGADGTFSITFRPNIGGVDQDFYIQLKTALADTSTVLWNLKLTKHNVKEVQDTTAVIAPPAFAGARVSPSQERVRAAAFWAFGNFWIALAGGANNAYASFAVRWAFADAPWTFGTLPCTTNSLKQIQGACAVAVFQDRLWYGVNVNVGAIAGKNVRAIRASAVGFGAAWGYGPQAGSTGAPTNAFAKSILFQFVVETETSNQLAGAAAVAYSFPCLSPNAQLIVKVANQIRRSTQDFLAVGHTFDFETARPSGLQILGHASPLFAYLLTAPDTYLPANGTQINDQDAAPGGSVYFNPAGGAGIAVNSVVTISRTAEATDPLDLNLAGPEGQIAWVNVLRGLMLGTARGEKRFSDGIALNIDPATGASFDIRDESYLGADAGLPALNVNEFILFAQRGRKVLRMGGINISSNGGLVSEDVGIAGEHLTKARIRSMCYLKSPVQRVVFAFDDGTGAVMTLVNRGAGLSRQTIPAFARFTIPACFGGIYNVASLDGDDNSELWIGTENGVTLRAKTFESDIETKEVVLLNAVPAPPTHLQYDKDNPLPPVMDGWVRAALVNAAGVQSASGLPASAVGQNAYALVNGQVFGPYVVAAGGKVVFPVAMNLDKTWVDASGARRAQEIYLGLLYPEHRWTSLPLEGGNPVGSSQNLSSRKAQLHLRFVDSYLPLVNGRRTPERGAQDPTDVLAGRVTGDRRVTEEGFQRAAVVDVVMDQPLRMEVSAIHGGVVMNNI
jgi:hypothetical protein